MGSEMCIRDSSVDVLLEGPPLREGVRVAVEFDGPSHFVGATGGDRGSGGGAPPVANGETRLRDALLRGGGFVVLAVPFFEWDPLRGGDERDAYLRARLAAALGAPLLDSVPVP